MVRAPYGGCLHSTDGERAPVGAESGSGGARKNTRRGGCTLSRDQLAPLLGAPPHGCAVHQPVRSRGRRIPGRHRVRRRDPRGPLRAALAVGLLQATNLSFLVVAVAVGRELDRLSQINDSALIVAGPTSAVIFPTLVQFLLGSADDQADSPGRTPSTVVSTSPGVANPVRSPQRRTPRDAPAPRA